jgi:hypothetical protein
VFADLDGDELRKIFEASQFDAAKYDALITEYERHLQTANDSDPEDRKWTRVKFIKPYKVDVDVQSDAPGFATKSYDRTGRATQAKLRQGSQTSFKFGDTGVFDSVTAAELIESKGLAKEDEKVYVRMLRDYTAHYKIIDRRQLEVRDVIATVMAEDKDLKIAAAAAAAQYQINQVEKTKLMEDLAGFTRESKAIGTLYVSATAHYQGLRQQLITTYRENNAMAAQIAEAQKRMAEKIDAKIAEALAKRP